jgi:hypothetical protein
MPSSALGGLQAAIAEVGVLLAASSPRPKGLAARTARVRVLGRACVVLLSSHFERYVYAVNEEAASFVNGAPLTGDLLPEALRLIHSKPVFDGIAQTSWDRRADKLLEMARNESWLWLTGATGRLDADRLLHWMTAPKPDKLIRYYKYWGIQDVFSGITRSAQTRGRLFFLVSELVDKRNAIAHGDASAQATRTDVQRYITTVKTFCSRADRLFARRLAQLTASNPPW